MVSPLLLYTKMHQSLDTKNTDEMQDEYGEAFFRDGVRGKHFADYLRQMRLTRIAPQVRAALSTDEALNKALRGRMRPRPVE